jgi:hypothetical protein
VTATSATDPDLVRRHLELQTERAERQARLIEIGILIRCADCSRAIPVEHAHPFKYRDTETRLCMGCCPRCHDPE